MNYNELNQYIKHYLEKDLSQRAILLTGAWGCGKSHYIKNTLKSFLKENGNHCCAIVSLYGLNDISEISKNIYFELRSFKIGDNSEAVSTGKAVASVVGKTLLNGFTSKLGFDFASISDEQLQIVYDSINLENVLVILEDFERSTINKLDVLGYVNRLVEQDGAKVLIVANENALIEYAPFIVATEGEKQIQKDLEKLNYNKHRDYTDETKKYLEYKEKTIGDTLVFECDYKSALKSIINHFENTELKYFCSDEKLNDIQDIFSSINMYNLRAFIFSCQKACDIFCYIDEQKISITNEIKEVIFYGIIAFIQRKDKGKIGEFDKQTYFSSGLGFNGRYPLLKYCYNYIMYNELSKDDIININSQYDEYCRQGFWNRRKDDAVNVLANFYVHPEKAVNEALKAILNGLKSNTISYYDYGIISNSLLALKFEVNFEIDYTIYFSQMLSNLKNQTGDLKSSIFFDSYLILHNNEAKVEFENFKEQINEILSINHSISDELINTTDDFETLYYSVRQKHSYIWIQNGFIYKINLHKFEKLINKCSANQLDCFRNMIIYLYHNRNAHSIIDKDKLTLIHIFNVVDNWLTNYTDSLDKIQLYQGNMLRDILKGIIAEFNEE